MVRCEPMLRRNRVPPRVVHERDSKQVATTSFSRSVGAREGWSSGRDFIYSVYTCARFPPFARGLLRWKNNPRCNNPSSVSIRAFRVYVALRGLPSFRIDGSV